MILLFKDGGHLIIHAGKEPLGRETEAAAMGITKRAGKNWINNELAECSLGKKQLWMKIKRTKTSTFSLSKI